MDGTITFPQQELEQPTMKAALVQKPGQIELIDIAKPTLLPGQVLVKIKVLGLCGSDTHLVYHWHPEEYPLPVGASGHECIGVVELSDSPGFQPGDEVLVLVNDMSGLAEYRLAKPEDLIKLPENGNTDHLVMAQPLGTVLWACQRVGNIIGKDVAVLGQGGIGLIFGCVLRRLGARKIIGIDLKSARLGMALRMGATDVIDASTTDPVEGVNELTCGEMADVVVEAAGEMETINLCYKLGKTRGQLVLFGVLKGPDVIPFNYLGFFRQYLNVFSSSGAELEPGLRSFRLALDNVARGEIDVSPMITHHFSFTEPDVRRAFHLAYTREEGAGRILLRFS